MKSLILLFISHVFPFSLDFKIYVRVERDTLAVYLRIWSYLASGVDDDFFRSHVSCTATISQWPQSHEKHFRVTELSFRDKF